MGADSYLVLAACCITLLLLCILNYAVGVLHVALVVSYPSHDTIISFAGALFLSQVLLVGPVASFVIQRFSCRTCVMAGSVTIAIGLCTTSFVNSVVWLLLTYGLIGGFGVGLAFTPPFVVVGQYFEKGRNIALGTLSFSGGVGMFIGGPMIQKLIDIFTVHGALLILGGMSLNIFAIGMLIRDKPMRTIDETIDIYEDTGQQAINYISEKDEKEGYDRQCHSDCPISGKKEPQTEYDASNEREMMCLNLSYMERSTLMNHDMETSTLMNHEMETSTLKNHDMETSTLMNHDMETSTLINQSNLEHVLDKEKNISMDRSQIENVLEQEKSTLMNTSELEIKLESDLSYQYSVKRRTNRILFNKAFLLILGSTLLWHVSLSIVLYHLPGFAIHRGATSSQAAFLVTIFGIANAINRLLSGLSIGPDGLDPLLINFGSNALAGGYTVLFPFFSHDFVTTCLYGFLFGLYSGSLTALITPLCVHVVGVKNLSTALGYAHFAAGIGLLAGPPLANAIIQTGGNHAHAYMFITGGLFQLSAAVFTFMSSLWIESKS